MRKDGRSDRSTYVSQRLLYIVHSYTSVCFTECYFARCFRIERNCTPTLAGNEIICETRVQIITAANGMRHICGRSRARENLTQKDVVSNGSALLLIPESQARTETWLPRAAARLARH
jgi:hypothetical protein